MSKKAEMVTLRSGTNVPAGTVMHLTRQQAEARRHLLTPVKGWHDPKGKDERLAFSSSQQVFFKAGEELGLEGDLDRSVAVAAGSAETPSPTPVNDEKVYQKGVKAGRAEMLKEVEVYNAAADAHDAADDKLAAAEEALTQEQDAAKKPALQKAVDEARTEAAAAKAAFEALPKIKA